MKTLYATLGAFVLLVASGLLYAFTLQHLWSWFVVAQFRVPSLSYAGAWGISLLVTLLTFRYQKPDPTTKWYMPLWYSIILCLVALALGALLAGAV